MRKKMLWIFFITLLVFSIPTVNMIGVTVAQKPHDIAVTSVTPSQTSVKSGEIVNITVVVKNNGTVNETFNVTLYYDSTLIETQNVTDLASGANNTLLFFWNTTNVDAGTYTIIATASTVSGETDTEDNTLQRDQIVRVFVSPYIAVVPHSIVNETYTEGTFFDVSIDTDYNGSDVWGWEFILTYNPLVLQGIEITNGDLINETTLFIKGEFDNELGELKKTGNGFFSLPGEPVPVTSGPGTLATVTFKVVGKGDSYITLGTETLAPSRLIGFNAATEEYSNIIDDATPDMGHILRGYFRNLAGPVTHDVAVINVTPHTTSVVAGELVNITVVVENQGNVKEEFDVKVYYDYNPDFPTYRHIGTLTASDLADGANKSLPFIWNTTAVKAGSYNITAVASELPDETDTEDNTFQSPQTVVVTERQEQPLPVDLIIGVPVAVVVIVVAIYALRRRKKPTPE